MNTAKLNHSDRSTNKETLITFFKEVALEYFSPIFVSWRKFESIRKRADALSEKITDDVDLKKALVTMQNAVCFNQSSLIQYTYLMAGKHKAVKDAYRSNPDNTYEIEEKSKDLIYFLNSEFHKIVYRNFEILHSYFEGRSKIKPRICLKGNFNTHFSDVVITVFRDSESLYVSDSNIEDNTGFSEVARTGKYYLCNDIPKAYITGNYKNPRLDTKAFLSKKRTRRKELLKDWKTYWIDRKSTKDERAFYKSTLIIPMTLWNNELSNEFRKKINVKDIGRTIFGFLCIDHVEENYFKNTDVRIGYVFADLLSHYVFQRSVYTDLSHTFKKVLEKIEFDEIYKSMYEEMPKSIEPQNIPSISLENFELQLQESDDNQLFGLDDELLEYLGKEKHITKP